MTEKMTPLYLTESREISHSSFFNSNCGPSNGISKEVGSRVKGSGAT